MANSHLMTDALKAYRPIRKHLNRYATEFEFRWNTRKLSDHARTEAILAGAIGRRLTYRPVAG